VACHSAGAGQGSTFSVTLPRLADDGAGALPAAAPGPAQRGAALDILLVDDNVDAAAMLGMLLEAAGHRVTVEHAASAALARVAHTRYDACLLDIGLPEMDGNALAARLRQLPNSATAVLIAITGYGQDADRQRTLAAGFDQHLVKPVDTDRLMQLLAQVGR
jgi:CheY-like chemotaxis protein